MSTDALKLFMNALDESRDFRRGPNARPNDLLRNARFSSVSLFSAIPADKAEAFVRPSNAPEGSWDSGEIHDIARGLDHGYERHPGWYQAAFESEEYKTRGLAGLCERAAFNEPEAPLTLLFGLNPGVQNRLRIENLAQLAGVARLAIRDTHVALVRGLGGFDPKTVPPVSQLDKFPSVRLLQRFSAHVDLFPALKCSDEEKYMVFDELDREKLLNGSPLAAVCAMAVERDVPVHRALHAYAKTHNVRAAIEAWDMPDEYLMYAFPKPTAA